ncbi:hypothetical protein [Burkholderia gladioli]|uniref:hypothetical protein n=1 Tax=Burkholderia gladioli TaxID=28095 RepID=UPI002FDFE20E
MTLQITIINMRGAQAPDFPSHLFPGAGSDAATFRVTAGDPPIREAIAQLLDSAIPDASLVEYDQATGRGGFVVVDGEAPAAGTVLTLGKDARSVADAVDRAVVPHAESDLAALTIEQFYEDLNRHDWYFGFSDDSVKYRNGTENVERLSAIAAQLGGDHAVLYEAFNKHYFSGEPWSTPKSDKPARPVDGVLVLPESPTQVNAVLEQHVESVAHPVSNPNLQIKIERVPPAREADIPPAVRTGTVSYFASFLVTQGDPPDDDEMFDRITCAIPGAKLVRYDSWAGDGVLMCGDAELPRDGAVIDLPIPFRRAPEWYRLESDHYRLEDFYDALNCHDWGARDALDRRVVWHGELHLSRLRTVAVRRGGDYKALFDAFCSHFFSGRDELSRTRPKPYRPVNGVLLLPPEPPPPSFEAQRRFEMRDHLLARLESKAKSWSLANRTLCELRLSRRVSELLRQHGFLGLWRAWIASAVESRRARIAMFQAELSLAAAVSRLVQLEASSGDKEEWE